jgi:hypothetical protein
VCLFGYCAWSAGGKGRRPKSHWELDWEWHSPEFLQCNHETMEALWELPTPSRAGPPIRGESPYSRLPYRYNFLRQGWCDYRSAECTSAMYSTTVHAFFSQDVQTFVSDLKTNGFDAVERYDKLVRARKR